MLIEFCLRFNVLLMLVILSVASFTVKLGRYAGGGYTNYENSEKDVVILKTDSIIQCSLMCMATERCCTIRYQKLINKCAMNFNCCPSLAKEGTVTDIVLQTIPIEEKARSNPPQLCSDLPNGSPPGEYILYPVPGKEIKVYCQDGWTVIQRRKESSPSFVRGWNDYKHGFGDVKLDHWLGNDNIHLLASNNKTCGRRLKVILSDWSDEVRSAVYNIFYIRDESSKYRLYLRGGHGNLIELSMDYFEKVNGAAFSTPDQDNDEYSAHCAQDRQAGWWFTACSGCCLNGRIKRGLRAWTSVHWYGWQENWSLKSSIMLLR